MPELTLPELRQRLRKEQQKLKFLDQELDQKLIPECQRRTCEGSLLEFTKRAWRWVEPSPFVSNWHIECMCEHFEAVAHRQILRLLINIPPRHSKSLGLNVFFPAWVWAQNPDPDGLDPDRAIRKDCWMGPGVRFAYLSYDAELSTNHSIKCRDLIESPWYHSLWPERFCLTQNLKTHYDNNRGGERKSGTIHGMTGFGANILGYDDPHDLQNVESDVKRNEVLKFYTEILPNRFNPEEPGALIVIMQRSHSRDISGHIIANETPLTRQRKIDVQPALKHRRAELAKRHFYLAD